MTNLRLPAEWEPQSAVLMAWPHQATDWVGIIEEARECFSNIIEAITRYQRVLLLVPDARAAKEAKTRFGSRLIPVVFETNDTWARDFGPITLAGNDTPVCLDFKFNGWGLKFPSNKDNLVNRELYRGGFLKAGYQNHLGFVLEGGAIESDGNGTIITTSQCQLSPNRNGHLERAQIEDYLKQTLAIKRVLWLNNGYLAGDDTDSHVDTLARFCDPDTIAYVKCNNQEDEHYEALLKMEGEIKDFVKEDGFPYKLIPLPMADTVMLNGQRLPATYANFLVINNAVLVPTYGSTRKDIVALEQLKIAFPGRDIIGINCNALIKQHGSLHCVTMQLPAGVID